jgi:plasmid stability protein
MESRSAAGLVKRCHDVMTLQRYSHKTSRCEEYAAMTTPTTTDPIRSTVYLDPELHQALRLKAAHSRRSMSDIVNDALRQALREDEADLAAVRTRSKERTLSYEDFLAKLKADGTL